ncbi:MAG: multidrug MFS transporter [Clostridiales bacterium]|nr:multidrug MFS transporter [Clostridiales bacterium]
MIFVTVGTHEQSFRRLVEYMDTWAGEHDEEVFIQSGYTKYVAKNAKQKDFLTREEMLDKIKDARIVISHGGPACYTEVQRCGKIPIVIPRSHKLGEQYDDHQIEIGREYKRRYNTILLVEDIAKLGEYIGRYDELVKDMDMSSLRPHNTEFCEELSKIVDQMFH